MIDKTTLRHWLPLSTEIVLDLPRLILVFTRVLRGVIEKQQMLSAQQIIKHYIYYFPASYKRKYLPICERQSLNQIGLYWIVNMSLYTAHRQYKVYASRNGTFLASQMLGLVWVCNVCIWQNEKFCMKRLILRILFYISVLFYQPLTLHYKCT